MRKRPEKLIKTEVPRPGEGKRGEQGHIGYLLRQAGTVFRHQMEKSLTEFGVTPPQFMVMTMLNAYPGVSNADIARLSLLTPQTVSVIISNLDRAGIVVRQRHEVHGRILQIVLSEEGVALLARCRKRVQVLEKKLLEGLESEEEAAVRRWLARLATILPNDDV